MRARLFLLAHGRSGDKGNDVNIGVIARKADWYPFLVEHLTAKRVENFLRPMATGPVARFELPNLEALNFLVGGALDGGGSVSMKLDAQGKTFAQALLRFPIKIPAEIEAEVRAFWNDSEFPQGCVVDEGDDE